MPREWSNSILDGLIGTSVINAVKYSHLVTGRNFNSEGEWMSLWLVLSSLEA